MNYNKIAIIGMMGSGKTTVSKLLADKTDINLIDTDEIFVQKYGNIKEYFAKFGEQSFRKKETEILSEVIKADKFILSCGGGIILSTQNRNILFDSDIFTIYLETSAEEIYRRVQQNASRPLLETEDKLKSIKDILSEREKYYSLANLTVITDLKTPEQVVNTIADVMKDLIKWKTI